MRASRLGASLAGAALLVLFSAGPALAEEVRVTGSGSGAEEAPDPGEEGATIEADMTIDTETGAITYTVTLAGNSEEAAAAHIHRASEGEAGDVVVPLFEGTPVNKGCVANVSRELIRQIRRHPARYYVNVHNNPFPDGAVRGQLHR